MAKRYSSTSYSKSAEYNSLIFPEQAIPVDVKYLKKVHSVQSKSHDDEDMMKFIDEEVKKIGDCLLEKDSYGNWYVTKGESDKYNCMVAHTDTVHSIESSFTVHIEGEIMFAFNRLRGKQVGVGGDDKVGVFMALTMLKLHDSFKAVFFRNEEVGCLGSNQADMSFFDDCTMVLQCDRRGSGDFVDSISSIKLQSDEFKEAVSPILKKYFYEPTGGGMTDVQSLKKQNLPVVCANMSCGYYSPHSSDEVVHIPSVENTMNMCFEIYKTLGHRQWSHKYEAPVYKQQTYQSYNSSDDYTYDNFYKTSTVNNGNGKYISKKVGETWYDVLGVDPNDVATINKLPYSTKQQLAMEDGYNKGGWDFKNGSWYKKDSYVSKKEVEKAGKEETVTKTIKVEEERGWRTVNGRWGRFDDEDNELKYYPLYKEYRSLVGLQPKWNDEQPSELDVKEDKGFKLVGTIHCPDCGTYIDRGDVVSMMQAHCSVCDDYVYIPEKNVLILE
jgi:tripeptide aminopeptidase